MLTHYVIFFMGIILPVSIAVFYFCKKSTEILYFALGCAMQLLFGNALLSAFRDYILPKFQWYLTFQYKNTTEIFMIDTAIYSVMYFLGILLIAVFFLHEENIFENAFAAGVGFWGVYAATEYGFPIWAALAEKNEGVSYSLLICGNIVAAFLLFASVAVTVYIGVHLKKYYLLPISFVILAVYMYFNVSGIIPGFKGTAVLLIAGACSAALAFLTLRKQRNAELYDQIFKNIENQEMDGVEQVEEVLQ